MSSSVLSLMILRYLSKLMIHASAFFPSNFGISNLIRLHGSSVNCGGAGACTGGAGGMGAGAGVACNAWIFPSMFASLCSICCKSCDCCTSNAARLISDCCSALSCWLRSFLLLPGVAAACSIGLQVRRIEENCLQRIQG